MKVYIHLHIRINNSNSNNNNVLKTNQKAPKYRLKVLAYAGTVLVTLFATECILFQNVRKLSYSVVFMRIDRRMWCVLGAVLFRGIRVEWIVHQFFLSSCSYLCFYSRNSQFIVTLETSECVIYLRSERSVKLFSNSLKFVLPFRLLLISQNELPVKLANKIID